jgi:hypothetical protein
MLLLVDHYDVHAWDADWEHLDPNLNDDDDNLVDEAFINHINYSEPFDEINILYDNQANVIKVDTTIIGPSYEPTRGDHYLLLKSALVEHFFRQYSIGDTYWPRRFNDRTRLNFPKAPAINRVLETGRLLPGISNFDNCVSLYTKPSDLRAYNEDIDVTKRRYSVYIGRGLFSSLKLNKNIKLATFVGDIIDNVEWEHRRNCGNGGYGIQLNMNEILDCFQHLNVCLASRANSAKNCYNISLQKKASYNCHIRIDRIRKTVALYTGDKIVHANVELCWNYSSSYIMNNN